MNRELLKDFTHIVLEFYTSDERFYFNRKYIEVFLLEGMEKICDSLWLSKDRFVVTNIFNSNYLRVFISKEANGEYGGNQQAFEGKSAFERIIEGRDISAVCFADKNGDIVKVSVPYEEELGGFENVFQRTEICRNGSLLIDISVHNKREK